MGEIVTGTNDISNYCTKTALVKSIKFLRRMIFVNGMNIYIFVCYFWLEIGGFNKHFVLFF